MLIKRIIRQKISHKPRQLLQFMLKYTRKNLNNMKGQTKWIT